MSSPKPKPRAPYRIETERLVVRAYGPDDAEALQTTCARCREHLLTYMPWAKLEPQTLDQKVELTLHFRARFDAREDFVLGIFDRATGRLVGGTGLHPRVGAGAIEIGYWITPENEGRGLITEAVRALIAVAFLAMGLDMVVVRLAPTNERSERIPVKLGFRREGLLRRGFRDPLDAPRDVLQFTLLDTEFESAPWRQETLENLAAFDALGRPIPLAP
jgi:RimJ/RimL family protein N-acetyltransferase